MICGKFILLIIALIYCSLSARGDSVHSQVADALNGLKAHKKVNPNPPPPPKKEKPKRQNRPIPKSSKAPAGSGKKSNRMDL